MAFLFSGCSTHCWFHLRTLKKWSCDDKFHDRLPDCVMNEALPVGKLLHSRSLLSLKLSSKIQSKTCYREEFDWGKIHRTDKICLELGTFEELQQPCCKLWPSAPRDIYYHVITILNPQLKTANGALNDLEKKAIFNRYLGSKAGRNKIQILPL